MPQITRKEREGEVHINNQGCLMKVIKYNSYQDVDIEFQDEYRTIVNCQYHHIIDGDVKNPYYPTVYGVGILGNKHKTILPNGKRTKEYETWRNILQRSFDDKYKNKKPTYKDITCCEEWLLFDNFYEWIHSQPNFDRWLNNNSWHIDKDILLKGNKIYSPKFCSLVPQRVNSLFLKDNAKRGDLPIGVQRSKHYNTYLAQCHDSDYGGAKHLGIFDTIDDAFKAYKAYKESIIKSIAKQEFDNGNITIECYNAMMCYEVEITD